MIADQTDSRGSTGSIFRLLVIWGVVSVAVLASMVVAIMLQEPSDEAIDSLEAIPEELTSRSSPEETEDTLAEVSTSIPDMDQNIEPSLSAEEEFPIRVPADIANEATVVGLDKVIIHIQSALLAALQNKPNMEVAAHLRQARAVARVQHGFGDIESVIDQAIQTIESIEEPPRLEIQRRLNGLIKELVSHLAEPASELLTKTNSLSEPRVEPTTIWDRILNTLGEIYQIRRVEDARRESASESESGIHFALLSALDRMKLAAVSRDEVIYRNHAHIAIDLARLLTVGEDEVEYYVGELESLLEIDFLSDVRSIERVLKLLDSTDPNVSNEMWSEQ